MVTSDQLVSHLRDRYAIRPSKSTSLAGARSLSLVDTVVSRYRSHISFEPDELARLGAVIRARPLVLSIWSWCYGRIQLPAVADDVTTTADLAEMIAARARESFPAG
jgi:hypothetical protein